VSGQTDMDATAYSSECPFCAIAAGLDPTVEVICEAPTWVAFFPDDPATLGHTLVIPRAHTRDFWATPAATASDLALGVHAVGQAIRAVLNPDGMNLISSAGIVAEQSVFHAHLHVVPRWPSDQFGDIWPAKQSMSARVTHDAAAQIRSWCTQLLGSDVADIEGL